MLIDENIGLIGPIIYYYENPTMIWCSGVRIFPPIFLSFPVLLMKNKPQWKLKDNLLIECDSVPSVFMARRSIIAKVGLFDEKNFPIGLEETDFALRIKKMGYKVAVYSGAKAFHDLPAPIMVHISKKRTFFTGRNTILFYKKYNFIRSLFFIVDLLSFAVFLLRNKGNIGELLAYMKGILVGFKTKSYDS